MGREEDWAKGERFKEVVLRLRLESGKGQGFNLFPR
jgi:hypothetical protein